MLRKSKHIDIWCYVHLQYWFHFLWFKEDPKECAIVDCAQDLAIEKCPQTCSEPALCQAADCSKEDSIKFCPKTCGEDSDQAKRNVASNIDKQNIWLQVSGPSLPVYGYKELGKYQVMSWSKQKTLG